jgi:hypothetical protein
MWSKSFVIPAAISLPALLGAVFAQSLPNGVPYSTWNWTPAKANFQVLPAQAPKSQALTLTAPTNANGLIFQAPPKWDVLKGSLTKPLEPGIYTTTPYACIVVVPSKHLDDQFVVPPAAPIPSMPAIKPELHFTPLPRK